MRSYFRLPYLAGVLTVFITVALLLGLRREWLRHNEEKVRIAQLEARLLTLHSKTGRLQPSGIYDRMGGGSGEVLDAPGPGYRSQREGTLPDLAPSIIR